MRSIKNSWGLVESALGSRRVLVVVRNVSRALSFCALECLFATGLIAQTSSPAARAPVAAVHVNSIPRSPARSSPVGITGLPAGPSRLPYPLTSTPANDAFVRNNAWAAYEANLRQIPTATNPNRLAARESLVDQDRFIQKPNSVRRYNFQFSDNEIRSVQAALRRMGMYSGQVDGILGPDTQRAIEEYQVRTKRPVTGQPDASLNASLGIF